MRINEKHWAAADLLVASQFDGVTREQQAAEIGVTDRTLRRWMVDDDFQLVLLNAQNAWRRQVGHIRFTHRRARLEELPRLLDTTPDEKEVLGTDKDGRQHVVAELEELKRLRGATQAELQVVKGAKRSR